jgi:hypothetical protein
MKRSYESTHVHYLLSALEYTPDFSKDLIFFLERLASLTEADTLFAKAKLRLLRDFKPSHYSSDEWETEVTSIFTAAQVKQKAASRMSNVRLDRNPLVKTTDELAISFIESRFCELGSASDHSAKRVDAYRTFCAFFQSEVRGNLQLPGRSTFLSSFLNPDVVQKYGLTLRTRNGNPIIYGIRFVKEPVALKDDEL